MSRLPPEIIGLLLAVLVLGVATVATGEDTTRTGAVGAPPSAIASAPPTRGADKTPAAEPLRTQTPVPRKPRSQPSPPKAPPRSKEKFQPNMLPAKRGGTVYLTFDDGPSQYTPAVLNILRATHSTATFFELGFRQAEHPAEAAQVRATGNNIGNHTYSHPDLTTLTAGEIRSEVARGPRSGCLRPPFGATDPRVRRILAQEGLREVLWTTDTKDWSRPGSKKIVKAATAPAVGAGSIVLMHDGGGDRSQTVAALPQIIATLQQRGYVVRRIPGC
ncbi:MAG TPA: polysaccharide deacetylase family protein [Propionibacteriaceae bacterium]|jgi:peptidoglycan-N-acetylglucosamine deacetylase